MSAPGDGRAGASARPSPPRLAQAASLAIAVMALAGALLASRAIEARGVAKTEIPQPIFFPRAEILRPALLGFTGLAADLTWVRTVQYFGSRIEGKERFPQLYQLVDMTTSLDPHFLDAYHYGGLFLTMARQYPNAIAIYRKGITANPQTWQLPHDLGRLYFLELQDYRQALHWWEITDRLPGRPHYIPRFLIRLQAKVGHRDTALELWQQMYQQSENEAIREIAQREIRKLQDDLKRPQAAAPSR